MNIHQLSVIYLDEQDRILVRFNTTAGEELRLWLTRRMLARSLEPLQDSLGHLEARKTRLGDSDPATRRMLADLKRAEVVQKSDFATPYKAKAEKLPLGSKPLVVTQMSLTVQDDRQIQIAFEERLPQQGEPRGFQVAMDSPMLHGFMHLLETALAKAQWNLGAQAQGTPPAGADEGREAPPPKYLQ